MASVGLVELPALKLVDENGLNWTAFRKTEPLASKQILAALLDAAGFDTAIVNMKQADDAYEYGQVRWRSRMMSKIAVGASVKSLDPARFDVWGVTVNYLQERDPALEVVAFLHAGGAKVVVGGSEALGNPRLYLDAGADAVVMDKSGAANIDVLRYVLGQPVERLTGVMLPDGTVHKNRRPPMDPHDWPLPKPWMVSQTLGTSYWEAPIGDELKPVAGVMLDVGCDRHCSFCQTPTYRIGYRASGPERAHDWLAAQRNAGAKSVIILSDQFLGRVLWPNGRDDVLAILRDAREQQLPILWGNGIELGKATLGRGKRGGDRRPDLEMVEAVWGWDGRVGCAQAYIPAERPLLGQESYEKLLPWQEHAAMMRAIVRAGVPDINYGVIVGLPSDSHATMETLLDSVGRLRDELRDINPDLRFRITPYAIRPLPGTPQASELERAGLVRFTDPAIVGGFWTACADTLNMSYEEVSDWQIRLVTELNEPEPDWQGITGLQAALA
ncbi:MULTISPECIES: hypothetical protein [Actinoplanes]|uniref:B12-binding domain-containing radical SAM protein n=1 Tax=Actinoplanes TaxID=1865 RepID=UPI0005F29AF2|nr:MULTISPECIES: hypothetical protein [Actinoplanes]GLY02737.1 hypothetical protein Acsp01_31160 [Actinoplanes sp. NBRC 101535]